LSPHFKALTVSLRARNFRREKKRAAESSKKKKENAAVNEAAEKAGQVRNWTTEQE